MTFVEELLAKEKEPYKTPPKPPSKEEIEHQKRHEYIMSGSFGLYIINTLKQELLDDIESARVFNLPMNRDKTKKCIFQEKEYRRKESRFRSKYYHDEETKVEPKERKQAYLDYYLPHCVFDYDEVKHLESQLRKALIAEGFQISFEIKEFSFKLCNGLGLGIKKKTYGYTVSFAVHW